MWQRLLDMERVACMAGVLALGGFVVADARADAIMPPPSSCPQGSVPIRCHGPDTCQAAACSADRDCAAGSACRELTLCTREHCCRGGWSGCAAPAEHTTHVAGPCGAGGACAEAGTRCTPLRVCVPRGAATSASQSSAGGAAAPMAGASRGGACAVIAPRLAGRRPLVVALVGLALFAARRARRRARQ